MRSVSQVDVEAGEQIVELLVNAGADVNRVSRSFAPLAAAVCKGNLAVARSLLEKEANVDQQAWKNRTALHYALSNDHPSSAADGWEGAWRSRNAKIIALLA